MRGVRTAIGWISLAALLGAGASCTQILGTFEDVGAGGGTTTTSSTSTGGSTSTSTSSSTTSSGSGGCTQASDCPAPGACIEATCTLGACGTTPSAAGATASQQTAGDCKVVTCDGSGGTITQNDDQDAPDDGNPCTADTCTSGVPGHTPTAGVCPGGEVCGDPAGPAAGTCVPAACANGMQDGLETDVDCGGTLCSPCAFGQACAADGDCQTGFCVSGTCNAQQLASGLQIPSAIAVDATKVYWANTGTTITNGSIMSVPKTGGSTSTIAQLQPFPVAIAVDATSVYWLNRASNSAGTVVKAPLGGGQPAVLANNQAQLGAIAIDGASVYWTFGSGIRRVALGGGAATALVSNGKQPQGLALQGTSLYFTTDNGVSSVPVGGGAVTALVSGQSQPTAIAADADNAYWLDVGSKQVMRAPLAGGPAVAIASGLDLIAATPAIAVDAAHVYFAATVGSFAGLYKVPIGGGPVKLIALGTSGGTVRGIALDAQYVYWTSLSLVRRALK